MRFKLESALKKKLELCICEILNEIKITGKFLESINPRYQLHKYCCVPQILIIPSLLLGKTWFFKVIIFLSKFRPTSSLCSFAKSKSGALMQKIVQHSAFAIVLDLGISNNGQKFWWKIKQRLSNSRQLVSQEQCCL